MTWRPLPLFALLVALPALAAAAPARPVSPVRPQEGWKILERVRRLATGAPRDAADPELSIRREALIAELERFGWSTRVENVLREEPGSGSASLGAIVAEKGIPGAEVAVLVASLPIGKEEGGGVRGASGAGILLEVAARLEAQIPRRQWRLVFVEMLGDDPAVARREAARTRNERISGVVAVERLGRSTPFEAIPFPEPGRGGERSSPSGVIDHLAGAARSIGTEIFVGDSGREAVFVVASRLVGVTAPSLARPFAEERAPAVLVTDAAPSDPVGWDEESARRAEIEPQRLAEAAALLEAFLVRMDSAPPPRRPDESARFGERDLQEDAARNLVLLAALLAAGRLVSYRRGRRGPAAEFAQALSALFVAAGLAMLAFEAPVPALVLAGGSALVVALLPPGRFLVLLLAFAVLAVPSLRLLFYLEVEAGGSGVFPVASGLRLLREPSLSIYAAGLLGATLAAAWLRRGGKGKKGKGGAADAAAAPA